jgi:ribosomal protein S18 acetylase RimI-like enzyme
VRSTPADIASQIEPPATPSVAAVDSAPAVRVRRARSVDLNEVAHLWTDCGLVPSTAGFRNEMQRKLLNDPELFLLAVDPAEDGRIVGAMLGGFDGRTATVSRMVTAPDRRGEGIASLLVRDFGQRLAALGGAGCRVVLLDELPEVEAVWTSLGYLSQRAVPAYRLPAS